MSERSRSSPPLQSSAPSRLSGKSPLSVSEAWKAEDTVVYLIYNHCGGGGYTYSLYKIDLRPSQIDDDVKQLPPPLFRLADDRFPDGMGFLTVETQILMFGGLFIDGSDKLSSDVLVYDTSKEHPVGVDPVKLFTKSMQMQAGKLCPIVLKIGGKIYVLSSTFSPYDDNSPSPRFEEFDMEKQSWCSLPDPPLLSRDVGVDAAAAHLFYPLTYPTIDDYEIKAYAVHDSRIIVSMPMGIYMFDVTSQAKWNKVTPYKGVDRLPFYGGAQYIDGMWYGLEYNRLRAYDFTDDDGLKNARDVPGTEHDFDSELVIIGQSNLVFSMGQETLGLVTSGLAGPSHHGRPHIIFHLLNVKELSCNSYVQRFAMTDSTDDWGNGGVVTACSQYPVVPEMQTLRISEQLPVSSPSESKDRFSPLKRPDNGGTLAIRKARLRVNHFLVKFNPESIIWHYYFDVKPAVFSKSILAMIRNKLFTDDPTQFPLEMTAYDGRRNIFSAVPLPTGTFNMEFSEGKDMKRRPYIFTIKLVNESKLCKLEDYLSGNLLSIPRDILQGMDLIMRENPARHMISVGQSFHLAESGPEYDLGCGITASSGFQQSLKPTCQGLAMCLDYSVLAFRKRMSVIDFLTEHVCSFNLNDFRRCRRDVEKALKGLKVTVSHRTTKQKYIIAGLTKENTRNLSFIAEDPEGNVPARQVSLVDYFKGKYNRDILYKDIPCLDLGKSIRKNHVPMEFCVLVEGQIYPKEYLDKNAALMLKEISLAPPRVREDKILNIVRAGDGPCGGGIARNFGIEVNMNMTLVDGRIIGPPELKLGAPNGRVIKITVDKEKCQWNLVGKAVVEGKSIERWAIIDFSSSDRYNRLNPNQFIWKLIARCKNLGMGMKEPLIYKPTTMNVFSKVDSLRKLLESVTAQANNLQIIVCVMAKKDEGYKHLKWISEAEVGVVTQCCLSNHANRGTDQYLANLALKINAKLGGSNVELNDRLPNLVGEGHVMFVGADVNHPGSRNFTSPSIAAVVATVNWPAANRYAARFRPQSYRTEKILNFGDMCLELVEIYARLNRVKPEKIVVFRDGVSEGQFDMVLNDELVDMKRAFETLKYSPTITVIVAQKRHQTRLFPESQRDGGSTGNVSPGTVVDTKIVHPFKFDFYLCSHYGSLGTSKPTHYYVLWDEHQFTSDQLQKLIYNMCFTFARCTKPVSLVPPVYYADLVAYRGHLYYEAMMEGQSPASAASSSSSFTPISLLSASSFDERFFKLHAELQNIMFFV